jgi:hypothetical protein
MAGKYRRGTITSPATANVVDVEWNENDSYDRRAADTDMAGYPVMTKKQGSGSFTVCSGTLPKLYDQTLILSVQDVSVSGGSESVTTKVFTFTHVTTNRGMSLNNDGGESSGKISFEFGEVSVA